MTELIPVTHLTLQGGGTVQAVDGRELHEFLEVASHFKDWIARRVAEYGFVDEVDFRSFLSETSTPGRPAKEYTITLDMAKELCMVERNEKGRQARRYFIECERRLRETHQPTLAASENHSALAVKYMQIEINRLMRENDSLKWDNGQLTQENANIHAHWEKDAAWLRSEGYRQALDEVAVAGRLVGRFDGLHAAHAIRAVLLEGTGEARVTKIIKVLEAAGYGLGIYPLRTVVVTVTSPHCEEMFRVVKHRNGDHLVSLKLVPYARRLTGGNIPSEAQGA